MRIVSGFTPYYPVAANRQSKQSQRVRFEGASSFNIKDHLYIFYGLLALACWFLARFDCKKQLAEDTLELNLKHQGQVQYYQRQLQQSQNEIQQYKALAPTLANGSIQPSTPPAIPAPPLAQALAPVQATGIPVAEGNSRDTFAMMPPISSPSNTTLASNTIITAPPVKFKGWKREVKNRLLLQHTTVQNIDRFRNTIYNDPDTSLELRAAISDIYADAAKGYNRWLYRTVMAILLPLSLANLILLIFNVKKKKTLDKQALNQKTGFLEPATC